MPAIRKLVKVFGVSARQAYALIEAGKSTPRLIKAASDEELLAIDGIGEAALAKLRRY